MNGWYKRSDGFLHKFEATYTIGLVGMNITELFIPDGVKEIDCSKNNLTKLIVPDGVNLVRCWSNPITELIIPSSVTYINCRFNNLTELIVPDNCIVVECDDTCKVITRTMYNRSKRLKAILK